MCMFAMVLPLIYVTEIDGELAIPPINKLQIEGLICRLGEDGVNAVMMGVQEHFGGPKTEGEQADAIKK